MSTLPNLIEERQKAFTEVAPLTENIIEYGEHPVDGSFYQIYKGHFEKWHKESMSLAYAEARNKAVETVKKVLDEERVKTVYKLDRMYINALGREIIKALTPPTQSSLEDKDTNK